MKKRILSMLLTIVMVVGLMPGFTLTASAATAVPRITGVKVLINGVEQPEGEIAITDSDTVTVVYTGENFEDLGKNNQDYQYRIGPATGNFYWFTIDTTGTTHTATKEYTGSSINYQETISYTNKGESETVTGYIIKEAYTVTVTNDGNGTGAATLTSGAEGTEVTLTATSNEGYQFKEWQVISGGVTVTDNKFNIGTANVEIKAVFGEIPAETNVASVTINGVTTEYATLKEAFTAASSKNATITLLRDYDAAYENKQPYITGNSSVIIFDLGGHTLSYTNLVPGSYTSRNPAFAGTCTIKNGTIEADNRYFALSAYSSYSCTMTIKGDVSINTTNEYGNAVGVTGNMTLIIEPGASITSDNDDRGTGGAICVYNGGKVIINGGSIVNKGSAPAIFTYNNGSGSTVVVNGGSVSDMKVGDAYFNVDNDATVTGNAWYKLTNSISTDKATVAYAANTTLYEGVVYGLGGAEVSLNVTPASGVTISKILANDTEATLFENVYSFTMPDKLVTLTAETQAAAHEHRWSYIANDTDMDGVYDTINAVCFNADNTCPNPDGGSVSITSPADLDYTGNAIEAVVTNNLVDTTVDVNVVYTAATGSELTEGRPVKVGTYKARITLGDATAEVTYEIKPAPIVTGIDFNRTSPAYDAATNTFYVSDDFPLELTVTGEYLTMLQNAGGLEAAFYGDTQNAGGTWMGMTIDSDTSAHGSYNTDSLTYAINNAGGGATYIDSIKVGDEWLNINLKYAPLFTLTINSSENGSIKHDHTLGDKIPEDVEVTLNVSPNSGYELETLTVDGQNVTAQVIGGKYKFTMPADDVAVSATFKALSHTHEWRYELVGTSTIKAVCDNTDGRCPDTDGGSLTIMAPAGNPTVYNGVAQNAVLDVSFTTGEDVADVNDSDIRYSASPINAGTYTAGITVDGVSASVTYSIDKKDISIETVVVSDKDYNGTEAAEVTEVTFKDIVTGEILAIGTDYTVSSAVFPDANADAENQTVTISVTLTDSVKANNYNLTNGTGFAVVNAAKINKIDYPNTITADTTVRANKAQNDLTLDLTDKLNGIDGAAIKSVAYTGNDKNLLAGSPSFNGKTVTYHVNNGTAVGDTGVIEVTVSSTNYKDFVVAVTVTATDKDTLTVTGVKMNAETYTYGDSAVGYDNSALAVTGTTGVAFDNDDLEYVYSGTLADGSDYAESTTAPTKAGSYTLTVRVPADNLDYTGKQEISFTIGAKKITRPAQASAVVYNGAEQTYGVTSTTEYTVIGGLQQTANENGYDVTVSLSDKFNTTWDDGTTDDLTHKFIISKKTITVTADNKEAYVGSRQPELTYKVEGLIGNDVLKTAPALTVNANMNRVGTYAITASGADAGSNYSITYVNGTLTVKMIYVPVITQTYDVEIADGINGGNVSASNDRARKDETVTVTVKPNAEYQLTDLTVTDSRGEKITVTKASDTKYTFKMPAYDVLINASFAKIPAVSTGSCPRDYTCPMYGYADLDRAEWYHDGVHFCIENDLMHGIGNGLFDPSGATTRAMIVAMLWRLEGEPVVNYAMSFKDVEAETWYTEAVRWAQANKIVLGYSDEAFGPNDFVTREQLATILYRYEQYRGGGFTGAWMIRMDYVDIADVSDWAYEAMCWCNMNGIITGKPDKVLDPKGSAMRAEAANVLYRYCAVAEKEN